MNPRVWELAYSNRQGIAGVPVILSKINSMGFKTNAVKEDELDLLFESLPPEWRFSNEELLMAGVENVFVPKPEYKDRIILSLLSGRN